MEIVKILGANMALKPSRERIACRAIIVKDDEILLCHAKKDDTWMLPGGGVDKDETLSTCLKREVKEETGCVVETVKHYLAVYEFYEEYQYVSHYYTTNLISSCDELALTKKEIRNGLTHKWVKLDEAYKIFSAYASYKDTNEIKRGTYLREFTGLKSYLNLKNK